MTSSTSTEFQNGKMDADTSSIYMTFDTVSLDGIFIIVLNQSDGSIIGSVRQRTITKQPRVGSVDATGNSSVYISWYSLNETYTELIKYDSSSNVYTIYEQERLNFRFQHVNTALSDCWIGLLSTRSIYLSQLSTMREVTGLTVNVRTNTGLTDETTSISSITSTGVSFSSLTYVTSISNPGIDLDISVSDGNSTTNPNNNSKMSVDVLPIVIIVVGSVVVVLSILTAILCEIRSNQKKLNQESENSKDQYSVNQEICT